MQKRQEYVTLEIASEKLDDIVNTLRDKLLVQFWSHVPDGERRREIERRLEESILAALMSAFKDIDAT